MRPALPLTTRLVLLVLVVVVVPLGLMGYWLTGVAARAGEDLLRSRLRQTNARAAAEMSARWMGTRAALLSFSSGEALRTALEERASGRSAVLGTLMGQASQDAAASASRQSPPLPELIAAFEALPLSVEQVTVHTQDGSPPWSFTRGPSQFPTFVVRVPIPSRQRGASLGELEARLRGEAVLGTEGAWGFAVGAVVAVIDPVG
jgi:hypothetical protein